MKKFVVLCLVVAFANTAAAEPTALERKAAVDSAMMDAWIIAYRAFDKEVKAHPEKFGEDFEPPLLTFLEVSSAEEDRFTRMCSEGCPDGWICEGKATPVFCVLQACRTAECGADCGGDICGYCDGRDSCYMGQCYREEVIKKLLGKHPALGSPLPPFNAADLQDGGPRSRSDE